MRGRTRDRSKRALPWRCSCFFFLFLITIWKSLFTQKYHDFDWRSKPNRKKTKSLGTWLHDRKQDPDPNFFQRIKSDNKKTINNPTVTASRIEWKKRSTLAPIAQAACLNYLSSPMSTARNEKPKNHQMKNDPEKTKKQEKKAVEKSLQNLLTFVDNL